MFDVGGGDGEGGGVVTRAAEALPSARRAQREPGATGGDRAAPAPGLRHRAQRTRDRRGGRVAAQRAR